MNYTWKPKEKLEGSVVVKLFNRQERIAAIKLLNITESKEEVNFDSSDLDKALKVDEIIKSRILNLDLKSGKHAFTSLDQLEYYSEYDFVIASLSELLFQAPSLGNELES